MAGVKITELTTLTAADSDDLFVIVDKSEGAEGETKHINHGALMQSGIAGQVKELRVNGAATVTDRVTNNNDPYHVVFSALGNVDRAGNSQTSGADSCFVDINRFQWLPDSSAMYSSGGIRTANGTGQLQGIADQALVADSANFTLTSINDVVNSFSGLATGQVLKWNGSFWENQNDLSGDAGSGVIAKQVNTVSTTADASFLMTFVQAVGTDSVNINANLTYNPSTDTLTTANLSGNASTATLATDATTAANANNLNADSASTNTLYLLGREDNLSSVDSVKFDTALSYNPSTETLSATEFSGGGAGLQNVAAASATSASAVNVSAVSNDATYYVHFGDATSGTDAINVDTSFTFNPATQVMAGVNLTYTTGDASQWDGTAPTTVDSALDRLATLVKTLNSGTGA